MQIKQPFSCMNLLDKIPWRNNQDFPIDITLAQAIGYGKVGRDNGLFGILLVQPRDDNCQNWLQYYGYLQMLYEFYTAV